MPVHPTALVESKSVGEGSEVAAYGHVMPEAIVGRRCRIDAHGFVEDGAVLGDDVTVGVGVAVWRGVTLGDGVVLGPGVAFTNAMRPRAFRKLPVEDLLRTHVGARAVIGANATVLPGIRIGAGALVRAGSVVTRDVPEGGCVAGNPARTVRRANETAS